MRSYISACLFSTAVILSGCSDDVVKEQEEPKEELVPVTLNVRVNDIQSTRSLASGYKYADGSSVSVLKCYVYSKSENRQESPARVIDIDVKDVYDRKGGEITLMLPKGEEYDVVFLGTSIPQTTATSKLYYNASERTLSLNYGIISCNDEEIDCFYASFENATTETLNNQTVELTRPLAQINIGTKDYEDYNLSTPVKDIAVSVDGVYNSVNLMTGKVIGTTVTANFESAPVPTDQAFPVNGFRYLAMNYVLVDTRKLVDLTITVNHSNSSESTSIHIPEIAVERNYQSNIYGQKLLTEELLQF